MIMDVTEIQKYLPHRYPFLMVDGILEIERLKRIVGVKSVSINEAHFQGHFPGQPVMPGVLIIESMAHTGGLRRYPSDTRAISCQMVANYPLRKHRRRSPNSGEMRSATGLRARPEAEGHLVAERQDGL